MVARRLRMTMAEMERATARAFSVEVDRRQIETSATTVDRSIDQLAWVRKYLPDYCKAAPSNMHRWLADETQRARLNRGTFINVVGPRGGAKTTYGTTASALRCGVEGTEPLIWLVSETAPQAKEFLKQVKEELEGNERLARDYPEACGKGRVWRDDAIVLNNGVAIEAYSIGQRVRGRRKKHNRPTLIIVDDLQSDAAMTSEDRRKKDWDWFTGALLKCGDRSTNVVNLATAIHREAVSFRLHARKRWKNRTFSAIVEWPTNMALWEQWEAIYQDPTVADSDVRARAFYDDNKDAMDAGSKLLWPEWEDLYSLMVMRITEGRATFEREKQGRPAASEDNEWPESYFDQEKIYFDEWPTTWRVKTMALDPSKGRDARRSDYSAIVMLMVGVDGVLYVDADLARRPTPTMISDTVDRYLEFRPDAFGVEANAWQELLSHEFEREFVGRSMVDAAPWLINNTVAKQVRIRRLGPYLAQGRLKFKANSPGARLLVGQLRDFPDVHSHDDGPDGLEMAHRLAIDFTSLTPASNPVAETLAAVGFQ